MCVSLGQLHLLRSHAHGPSSRRIKLMILILILIFISLAVLSPWYSDQRPFGSFLFLLLSPVLFRSSSLIHSFCFLLFAIARDGLHISIFCVCFALWRMAERCIYQDSQNSNFHAPCQQLLLFLSATIQSSSCILEIMHFRIPFSDFNINEINVATSSTHSVVTENEEK